jgi:hypothetical protein
LPLYLAFFQLVHDALCRGRALLSDLVAVLVMMRPTIPDPDKSEQRYAQAHVDMSLF